MTIRARTLGVLELAADEGEVPPELHWRKNSALLVYLALSPHRTRTREHLCGLLWPDKPDRAARHSLNEALRTIRRSLGEGGLESDARQVRLSPDAVALDVEELEAALKEEAWDRAASLVGGTFLEGFGVPDASPFEDWLLAQREAWSTRSVHALTACADAQLAVGRVREAAELAARSRSLDPFSDLAAQVAVRAAALAGDRGEALAKFEAFARRLRDELGAEPAPETQRLADRVRRERTWRLPPALESAAGAAHRIEFLGREREMRRLVEGWSRSRTGARAGLMLVEGEGGVGKTRLLEEIAGRARLDGATVAGIRAVPADREIEWSGLLGLCRGGMAEAPGVWETPPEALAALCAALPEWKERFGEAVGGAEPCPLPRAFSDLLRAATTDQPVLLFVDDAQWLDSASWGSLRLLLRDLERRPLVLVAAADAGGKPVFDELASTLGPESDPVRVEVRRWDHDTCEELVATALPGYETDRRPRLARRILADSAGLPLLAVELAHAVRDGMELGDGETGSVWLHTNRTLDDTLPGELPDAVRAAVRVRFRRLSAGARTLLAVASLAGERFDPSQVAERAGLSPRERDAALDELEWHRWLQAEPRGYSFVARIVRDIVSQDLLTPGQRRRWSGHVSR